MLTRMTISNVKHIVSRVIELSGCTILLGVANRGKTSVLDSVRLLLGCADRSDARGNAGVLPYMAIGAANMTVAGVFTDPEKETIEFVRSYSGRQRTVHAFTTPGTQSVEETQALMAKAVGDCVFDTRALVDFEAVVKVVSAECEADSVNVGAAAVLSVLESVLAAPKGTWDALPDDLLTTAITKLMEANQDLRLVPREFLSPASYDTDSKKVSVVCDRLSLMSANAAKRSTEAYGVMRQANAEAEGIGKLQAETVATPRPLVELNRENDETHTEIIQLRQQIAIATETAQKAQQQVLDIGEQEEKLRKAESALLAAQKELAACEKKMKKAPTCSDAGISALRAVLKSEVLCAKCRKAVAAIIEESEEDDKARTALKRAQGKVRDAQQVATTEQAKAEVKQEEAPDSRNLQDVKELEAQLAAKIEVEADLKKQISVATERDFRAKRLIVCRASGETAKKTRAVLQNVAAAIDSVWAAVVKAATEPFIDACNATLAEIKSKTTTLEKMGVFNLEYTGGKMRFGVVREEGAVLYHTMGGTERVVVRNIVGCAVLSHRIKAGTAREGILLDDIAELSDEAVNPFLSAMVEMLDKAHVQCICATCHLGRTDIASKAVHAVCM